MDHRTNVEQLMEKVDFDLIKEIVREAKILLKSEIVLAVSNLFKDRDNDQYSIETVETVKRLLTIQQNWKNNFDFSLTDMAYNPAIIRKLGYSDN
ncbi:hypothetical protein [Draconibacterium mangrovi]|uniref:hypothetical protein n=1 Tax=Draconibacterium mangrovi TaxID=2697469 RepID=UPI0013D30A26|nr:hypothetical protein [Draconibacterium mangrovi]